MFQRLINRLRDKKVLLADGVKTSVNYSVIINNDDAKIFPDYKSALDCISNYRKVNQIFNLSVFRIEIFSLTNDFKN